MTPITPNLEATGIMKTELPEKWLPAFTYITMMAVDHPEVAGFPTIFLAAYNQNETALKRVFESSFAAHYAAQSYAKTQDEITLANAMVWLVNKLAESMVRGELPNHDEKPKAQDPKPAPVQAERKPSKPARIDPAIQFITPGTCKTVAKGK